MTIIIMATGAVKPSPPRAHSEKVCQHREPSGFINDNREPGMQQLTTNIEKFKAIHGVVLRIPSGFVASYGQVAALAGLPGRARLAGKALGTKVNEQNIPWYRVLRSDGKLAFNADSEQFRLQATLLISEGVMINNGRVNMSQFQWDGNF